MTSRQVAEELVEGDAGGHVGSVGQAEHEHGHDAAGGGEEGEEYPVNQAGHVLPVTVVGEQADVESEAAGL